MLTADPLQSGSRPAVRELDGFATVARWPDVWGVRLPANHCVLLVDDNEDVRMVSADMLEELGYRVVQASNGFEALDRLAEDPCLDVMVTDIRMPGMSGFELCDLACARHEGLKIVMISGYYAPQATVRKLVRKPFRTVELANAIQEALAS